MLIFLPKSAAGIGKEIRILPLGWISFSALNNEMLYAAEASVALLLCITKNNASTITSSSTEIGVTDNTAVAGTIFFAYSTLIFVAVSVFISACAVIASIVNSPVCEPRVSTDELNKKIEHKAKTNDNKQVETKILIFIQHLPNLNKFMIIIRAEFQN
ncbi:MAG: hypothetical protein WCN92_07440 [Eubacteriales bacterium]